MVPWSSRLKLFRVALLAVLSLAGLFLILMFVGLPRRIQSHICWRIWSAKYKEAVLSSSDASTGLRHAEWDGDGWGGATSGDWTGYVVYDPRDSLAITDKNDKPRRIQGIPCDVVSVRRLEKKWYSVVTDMSQFWDTAHPNC
jgi:hypothetical protein